MLTLDMFVLLVLVGTVSALDPSLTFNFMKYPRVFRRNDVACQVCYGEFDCLSLDKGRCGYNVEATAILKEEEEKPFVNEELNMRVDSMMYDLLLDESIKVYKDCVPLVSSYTQCNKENICTGCKSCDCDEKGRWNCSVTQKCSSRHLHVDHRVLGLVMDSLKIEHNTTRSKREASEESSTHSIYDDLAEWMYVSKPVEVKLFNGTTTESTGVVEPSSTTAIRTFNDQDNSNNLAFDEILSNDGLAHFIKSSEKDISNMKGDNNDTQQFLQFLKQIEEDEDITDTLDNTHLNIDLLKGLNRYFKEEHFNGNESSKYTKDQPNSINSILSDTDDLNLDTQQLDANSVADALRRNVRQVTETMTVNSTSTNRNDTKNFTQSKEELQQIVDVVSVLISNQRKETVHLNYVKDNLLKFIKKYEQNSNSTDAVHKQNIIGNDTPQDWKNDMLNFYVNNLNKDMKDILKDIYAIEKLRKLGVTPTADKVSNIKPLLLVLSSYYLKNKKVNRSKDIMDPTISKNSAMHTTLGLNVTSAKKTHDSEPKLQRRLFDLSSVIFYNVKLLKRALTRMLLIIDNDKTSTTAINALSPSTKHLFNRIINKQYVNDVTGLTIRDSHFNLTTILSSLAESWRKAEVDIFKFHPADRLYNMKLLYFTLIQGIDKIKEALNWIKFGQSRRMSFIEEHIGKDAVDDATKILTSIDNRVNYFVLDAKKTNKLSSKIMKDKPTESVWHHIKNAFSKSKNGVTKYFKGKFKPRSRSYIVNENVKKRVEEINKQKFLDVMRRWQENFEDSHTRSKRSLKHYAKRMKNIIPKYLRGKVTGLNGKGKGGKKKYQARVENKGQFTTKRPVATTKTYKRTIVPLSKTTKKQKG